MTASPHLPVVALLDHIKGFSYSAPYEDLKLRPGR